MFSVKLFSSIDVINHRHCDHDQHHHYHLHEVQNEDKKCTFFQIVFKSSRSFVSEFDLFVILLFDIFLSLFVPCFKYKNNRLEEKRKPVVKEMRKILK